MTLRRSLIGGLIALGLLGATTACAPTSIDTSVTVEPPVTTPVTMPTGTPAELLPQLVATAGTLSDLIGSRGKKSEAMGEISALWNVTRPQLADQQGDFATTMDAQVALCQIAVDRNRPADADKCYRNVTVLVDTYLK